MFNQLILIGRLGADPEVQMVNGQQMARFRLATSDKWTDKEGAKQERTEWHRCEFWGRKAEVIGQYLAKGSKVQVVGKMTYRQVEDTNFIGNDGKPLMKTYANVRGENFLMLDSNSSVEQSN